MQDFYSIKKIIRVIRFILILFIIGVIGWLFYKDFVPKGRLEIKNDFKKKSVLISGFYPENRIMAVEKDNDNYFQAIRIDPVYFDVNIPRFFKTAKVIIKYQNLAQNFFQIGLKNVNSDWDFLFKILEDNEKGIEPTEKDGWQIAEADFELQPWFIEDNKLYFIISSPLLYDKRAEIKISEIKIILAREPWSGKNFLPRLINYLKKLK